MIRRNATTMCLFGVVAANVLLIGAAAMRPKAPANDAIVAVPPAPPMASSESSSAPAPVAASAVPAAKDNPRAYVPAKGNQIGVASWYGDHWQGRLTAGGKPFDDRKLTAAHRTLPLNTRVRVTNLETGRSVEVTITDRGPYVDGRVIDLSAAAAKRIGMVKEGLVPVQITTVAVPDPVAAPETPTKVASLDGRS